MWSKKNSKQKQLTQCLFYTELKSFCTIGSAGCARPEGRMLRERTGSAGGETNCGAQRGGTPSLMKGSWEKWSKETYLHEEKRWEKKKKVAQWKKGNPDQHERSALKHRWEADMQTRCQLAVPEGGRSSPPGSGPEASRGPSGSGSILRRPMNRILKQMLNSTHLSEYLIILDASNFPHRITTRIVLWKRPWRQIIWPTLSFSSEGREGDMLFSFHGDRHVRLQG